MRVKVDCAQVLVIPAVLAGLWWAMGWGWQGFQLPAPVAFAGGKLLLPSSASPGSLGELQGVAIPVASGYMEWFLSKKPRVI